jgi:hypothetical protein
VRSCSGDGRGVCGCLAAFCVGIDTLGLTGGSIRDTENDTTGSDMGRTKAVFGS